MLVILSGPSGVGKDTVINAWREVNPRVERVVAYTTRQPRPGEVDGVDYHFISHERFAECAAAGEFLEYKEVHDYHYATPLKDMEALLAKGCIAILKIDVQGALTVMSLRPEALTVFLLPPDSDELASRIRRRGTESDEAMAKRLAAAQAEIQLASRYEHAIVNDDVDRVVAELQRLVADVTI
jgi:guanylate kinase